MSERKVLNKYYPPDFDPNKIPRLKVKRDGKFGIRLMAPFNMRCNTCGEYIYKGKKFNSRKEDVVGEDYLGLHIFRFYIKCPRCVAEIAFKTDPENTDYTLEAGATRNFEALRTAERLARQELEEKEAEEKNNPMKLLENRTKASLQEMDMIETLEELREMRQKHSAVSLTDMIESSVKDQRERVAQQKQREEEEDEQFIKSLFGQDGTRVVKRLDSDDEIDDHDGSELKNEQHDGDSSSSDKPINKKMKFAENATDILVQDIIPSTSTSSKQIKFAANTSSGHSNKAPSSSAINPSAKSSATSSLKQKLLGGIVVKTKGKEPLSKSSATGKNGAVVTESSSNMTTASEQKGSLVTTASAELFEPSASSVENTLTNKATVATEITVTALAAAESNGDSKSSNSVKIVDSGLEKEPAAMGGKASMGGLASLASYSDSDSDTSDP